MTLMTIDKVMNGYKELHNNVVHQKIIIIII
jgi:hypothetical protein